MNFVDVESCLQLDELGDSATWDPRMFDQGFLRDISELGADFRELPQTGILGQIRENLQKHFVGDSEYGT